MRWSTNKAVIGCLEGCDVVKVLVGDEQREFTLHRKLLCDSCAFFQTNIDAIPSPASPGDGGDEEDSVLWFPNEAPDMFELFVLWLYQRKRFPSILDRATQIMTPDECRAVRTNLVRLHLFAAVIDLPPLQDAATDALQDMYLRFDWDMSPSFLAFLYGDCDAQHAVRLRKWGVAMLAWTLQGADKATALAAPVEKLLAAYPELQADYAMHLHKMAQSRADVRIKNPQLRLPVNKMHSGERFFGFRQCTFHSHRATVGEGVCPHALALGHAPASMSSSSPRHHRHHHHHHHHHHQHRHHSARRRGKQEEADSDASDAEHPIISPVGDLNEISYLDLS